MKILTLNPPFVARFTRSSRSPAISKGGCVYYPLWLTFTTGVLEQDGHNVKLVDAPAASLSHEEVYEMVEDFRPNLIVLDTVTASFNNDKKVAADIKEFLPDTFIAMVGTHVTALPDRSLMEAPAVDAVVRGEQDFVVRDLAGVLGNGRDLSKVRGLSYRTEEGKDSKADAKYLKMKILDDIKGSSGKAETGIKHNLDMPWITGEELDRMKFSSEVYSRHLNIEDYFYPSVLYPEVTIITSRGCYYRCTFCKFPQTITGHEGRTRSVQNIVDEFQWITDNLPQVKDIMIEDDTMTQDRKRIMAICDEIKNRQLNVTWTCNARADLDYDVLKNMKQSGCREVCVGFESASQEILNNIRKGTKVEKIRQFAKDTKKAGVLVHGCFMLGNMGETKETIKQTIDFAKELDPDTAQFFPLMLYPGTEAYKWAQQNNFLTSTNWNDWLKLDGTHNTNLSTDKLTAKELVAGCDRGRVEFYMRPTYIGRKVFQGLTNPREYPRLFKSGKTFFKYLKEHVHNRINSDFWTKPSQVGNAEF